MKNQILFSGQNKKNFNFSTAELSQRVIKVNYLDRPEQAV